MASNGKLESLLNEAIAALQAEPVPMADEQIQLAGYEIGMYLSELKPIVRKVEAFHNIKPKGE